MKIGNALRRLLGNDNFLIKSGSLIINEFFCLASRISPKLNCKLRYRYNYGRKLNIDNPQSFIEKCSWYKVNIVNKHEIFRTCSDKYAVRDYIKSHGCDNLLNELIAVYDRVEDIEWEKLPNRYVIKLNDGCGYYLICTDKTKFDIKTAKKKLKKWWKEHNYLLYAEMQNKASKRRIVIEKYIEGPNGAKQPIDYKIYCFHGVPSAILCVWDRDSTTKELFMSPDWIFISAAYSPDHKVKGENNGSLPPKPKNLSEMLEYAKKLSKPFPFVRCDFYQSSDGPVFGELTFTAAGGMFTSQPDPSVLDLNQLFHVPCKFNDFDVK